MLESIGFSVVVACDGREAVQRFHDGPDTFSIVLLDMIMPYMDGHETLRSLRAIRPDVPVLIASGYTRKFIGTSNHHRIDFIAKPYHRAELAKALQRLLAENGTAQPRP
jgi:CheY-like chemotaxis protein